MSLATIVNAGVLTLGPGGVINAGALSTANVADIALAHSRRQLKRTQVREIPS